MVQSWDSVRLKPETTSVAEPAGAGLFAEAGVGEKAPAPGCCCAT